MNKEELFETYKAVTGNDVDNSPILAGLLKNADPKFYRQIEKLCTKNAEIDRECVASILDHIAVLVVAREEDAYEKKERRKKSNVESVKRHRERKKLFKHLFANVDSRKTDKKLDEIIAILSKEVDKGTAKKLALEISPINGLPTFLGVRPTGGTLLSKHFPNSTGIRKRIFRNFGDNSPTKENKYFNIVIYWIYSKVKETTKHEDNHIFELVSKILTSLNIRKKNGENYLRQDFYQIISTKR